ncbi:hypothetical protein, partial [Pseudomonas sp. K5]|uniref:hypothetical protein n=1 Tax=Pseudomonas sp. K5 TaxID=1156313 RepID=UPI001D01BBA4
FNAELVTPFDAPSSAPVDTTPEIAEAPIVEHGLEAVELTGADDLSRFYEHTLPESLEVVDVAAAEPSQPLEIVAGEIQAIELEAVEVEALHDAIELEADVPVATGDSAGYSLDAVEEDAIEENEEAAALDDVIPATPAFGETVELQQALDDGLTIVDGPDAEATAEDAPVLGLDARHEALDERDAFAEAEAGLSDAEEASPPAPLFELEEAPLSAAVAADEAAVEEEELDDAGSLDFSVLDRELVDIFVEEGKDLLDHCDGLISELRAAPQDREAIAGLQRDLHTLKG